MVGPIDRSERPMAKKTILVVVIAFNLTVTALLAVADVSTRHELGETQRKLLVTSQLASSAQQTADVATARIDGQQHDPSRWPGICTGAHDLRQQYMGAIQNDQLTGSDLALYYPDFLKVLDAVCPEKRKDG
jgi:hypothetical protein